VTAQIVETRAARWRLAEELAEGKQWLVFDSVERRGDQLRVRVAQGPIPAAALQGHAQEPDFRYWIDDEETRWLLSLELPSAVGFGPQPPESPKDELWLTFDSETHSTFRPVPMVTSLGDLTHEEIRRLLGASVMREEGR
jgi:hypothetical protein